MQAQIVFSRITCTLLASGSVLKFLRRVVGVDTKIWLKVVSDADRWRRVTRQETAPLTERNDLIAR